MKKQYLLIFVILFIPHFIYAQKKYQAYNGYPLSGSLKEKQKKVITVSLFGPGILIPSKHTGNLSIDFPYEVGDNTGNHTSHVFHADTRTLFSKNSFELTLLNLDISTRTSAVSFSGGLNFKYGNAFFSLGYGRNIYLGHRHDDVYTKKESCDWILRPSLNAAYNSFNSKSFGSIDNTNSTIYLLGYQADPTFSYQNGGKHSHTVTTNAHNLEITYKQNEFGVQPKLALCTNPYKYDLSLQISVSYFIPLAESGGLSLTQFNASGTGNPITGTSVIKLNNQDITATYNNQPVHSTPFHIPYVFMGFILGYSF